MNGEERKTKAVALQYDALQHSAPKVVAAGKGTIAEQIIQKAQAFDIPLFSNPELADSLISLKVDTEIPPQLYQAVADVFVWLMKQEAKLA